MAAMIIVVTESSWPVSVRRRGDMGGRGMLLDREESVDFLWVAVRTVLAIGVASP